MQKSFCFWHHICTGAPNVRPPKKKLITLDEVTHLQLCVFCPCLMFDFPYISFCFQHFLRQIQKLQSFSFKQNKHHCIACPKPSVLGPAHPHWRASHRSRSARSRTARSGSRAQELGSSGGWADGVHIIYNLQIETFVQTMTISASQKNLNMSSKNIPYQSPSASFSNIHSFQIAV